MNKEIDLKDKFLGSIIGCAIGDAIGEQAFLHTTKEELCYVIEKSEQLYYTDDTAMTIAIIKSILEIGDIEEKHLGDKFSIEFYIEPWRGYAPGPPTVFDMVRKKGISYSKAASMLFDGQGSFGNGAAMRVAPIGIFYHDLPPEVLYEKARLSALVTHSHPVGIDGAAVQAMAIAMAIKMHPEDYFFREDFIEYLIQFSRTNQIRDKMKIVKDLIEQDLSPKMAIIKLGRSVAVHESMPFSVYSFLKHYDSFEECLFCAVLHGGDRDTLGAMACSISGAYLGIRNIPEKWIKKLENFSYINDLCLELYEKYINNRRF